MRQVTDFVVKKTTLSEDQLTKIGEIVQNVSDIFDSTFDNVLAVLGPLHSVFKTFVPEDILDRLANFTSKIAAMTKNFKLTESELYALKTVFSVPLHEITLSFLFKKRTFSERKVI